MLLVLAGGLAVQGFRAAGPARVVLDGPWGPAPAPAPALAPDRVQLPVRIRPGATFGGLMQRWGLPAHTLRQVAREHHDLAAIRPDRALTLTFVDGDPSPVALSYALDEDRTVVVERAGEDWTARLDAVTYEAAPGRRAFTITRSLWQDGLDAGLRPMDLVRLARIFEYEVDFNTELRDGAGLVVAADVLTAEGRRPRLGDLHAVRLTNAGASWTAVRHVASDGSEAWFQPDGRSLRRPFLRSPLEFSRVTSGFNPRRYHPVLKRRRPHNGTDFGAPTGTPVRAVADGRVVRAGWAGGHGRFVKLDHDGPWETSYSHLSRITVKRGTRVRQGQVIGHVGASGLATGPHLHFQMWRDGRFVDPMAVDLPRQAPLAAADRPAFEAAVARWLPVLDGADPAGSPDGSSPGVSAEPGAAAGPVAADEAGAVDPG